MEKERRERRRIRNKDVKLSYKKKLNFVIVTGILEVTKRGYRRETPGSMGYLIQENDRGKIYTS